IHAELRITMSRVVMTDPRTELPHPSHRRGEIVFHAVWDIEPEFLSFPDFGPCARGPDDTLGRDTADIEAVSAHEMPLDQRHFGAYPGSDHGRHQPGRAGPNHNDVVSATRLGILPVGRMNIVRQRLVVLVIGWNNEPFAVCHDALRCRVDFPALILR